MLPYTNSPTHDDFLNRLDIYQSQYDCSNLSILTVLDMTPDLLEGIIQSTKNVNARLFSLLDLLTNKHPNYELHKRDTSTPQITQPLCVGVPEKAVDIQTVLRKLTGTTIFNSYALESASNIIGLSQNVLMGYLKNVSNTTPFNLGYHAITSRYAPLLLCDWTKVIILNTQKASLY